MGKIVTDRLRPSGSNDSVGVEDCGAAPALLYADAVLPFSADYPNMAAYFNRLVERPSFARTLEEARPHFHMVPARDDIPARFRDRIR